MAYSMTGFGAAEGATSRGRLRAEIRTVNHRFFNLAAKLPTDLAALEPDLRERLRQEFDRGTSPSRFAGWNRPTASRSSP